MFDHLMRELKDRWLAPLARLLGRRVSPDATTVAALVVGLAAAAAVLYHRNTLALALWLLNRFLDGLDGTLARVHNRQSDFGGYLDIVLDFVVYAAIPLAMVLADGGARIARAGAFLLATFFVNAASWMYLAAILERRNAGAEAQGELTTITMPPGVIAGTETVIFYCAFLVVDEWQTPGFVLMGGLVCLNVVQRLYWASRQQWSRAE